MISPTAPGVNCQNKEHCCTQIAWKGCGIGFGIGLRSPNQAGTRKKGKDMRENSAEGTSQQEKDFSAELLFKAINKSNIEICESEDKKKQCKERLQKSQSSKK